MRKLLAFSALLVLIDQATKMAVKGFSLFGIHHEGMYLGQSIPVIGDVLRFTFVENPGMAFGLDFGMPLLLGLFSIGAAIFLVHLLRKSRDSEIGGFHIALAMILGGAVGNLIDRVFYGLFYGYAPLFRGKVVDFIDVDIPDITIFGRLHDRFYVFNIADAAVSVGIVLLLIFYPKYERMVKERKEREEAKKNEGRDRRDEESPGIDDTVTGGMMIHQVTYPGGEENRPSGDDDHDREHHSSEGDATHYDGGSHSRFNDSDSTQSSSGDSGWSDSGSSDSGSSDSTSFD